MLRQMGCFSPRACSWKTVSMPSSRALSVKEVQKVLDFIARVKELSKACVYISHTIVDVYSVSDRFVILDRGRVAARYRKDQVSERELVDILRHVRA